MELNKEEKRIINEAQKTVDNWYWNKWVLIIFSLLLGLFIYFQGSELRGEEDIPIIFIIVVTSMYVINNWAKPVKASLIIKLYESED